MKSEEDSCILKTGCSSAWFRIRLLKLKELQFAFGG